MTAPNRLARLPFWLSHWLGYRPPNSQHPKPLPLYLISFWSFIGAFCGLAVIQGTFGYSQYFLDRNVPIIVASYGASAVLCYGAIEAPLAQPRALVGGHFISALIGLCITKLFRLLPEDDFNKIQWLVSSLCTAVAIVAMQITKTTHPPAGASAFLPAVSPEVWTMSWYYLPVILLSSAFVLVTALIINNIQRRYPVFWWTPSAPVVAKSHSREHSNISHEEEAPTEADDEEAQLEMARTQQVGIGFSPAS